MKARLMKESGGGAGGQLDEDTPDPAQSSESSKPSGADPLDIPRTIVLQSPQLFTTSGSLVSSSKFRIETKFG